MQNTLELGLAENDGSGIMPEVINNQVDARSVHETLEIITRFDDWFRRRVEEFGFVEGEDFSSKMSKTPLGGRPRIDYILTLDMAKELAMVERNEMGRKMRRYFIECEKRLHQATPPPHAAGALPTSTLLKLQEINAGLIEEVQHHASRIEQLENINRPGIEWCTVKEWLDARPELKAQFGFSDDPFWRRTNRSIFATIGMKAKKFSERAGLCLGWRRDKVANSNARSYRPDAIAAAIHEIYGTIS